MFSKKSLHISLAFILVIALATLGLAYGAWSDLLTIDGSVTTGSLNVDFIGTNGPVADVDPLGAGTCSVAYGDDLVTITISGAYPGYQCVPLITIKNTGTVPALATINLPWTEPQPGMGAGGVSVSGDLPVGAETSFSVPFEVYDTPPMNTTVTYSFPIPVVQALP
jgi:hypothetical protein